MMFSFWLLKRFGMHVMFVVVSLTALLSMFDLLAHANGITAEADGVVLPLVYYLLLRIPQILVFIAPFAVLIAALQTFAGLASHQEIIPLQTSGYSLYRITAVFVAAVLVLGIVQFFFTDRIVTGSVARLHEWSENKYRGLPEIEFSAENPEWVGSGNYIVHMSDLSADGKRLEGVTLIWRNEIGATTRYLEAKHANFSQDGWVLENTFERNLSNGHIRQFDYLPVSIDLKPLHFAFLNREAEVLKFSELMILGSGRMEPQLHPPSHYLVAAWRRIAQPLGMAVMVLLAAPVGLQLGRFGRRIWFVVFAMAMGFSYFIVERILLTLGETGDLPAGVAVWAAPLLFCLIGLGLTIHQQK